MTKDIEKANDLPAGIAAQAAAGPTARRRGFLVGGAAAGVAGAAAIALKTGARPVAGEVAGQTPRAEPAQGRGYHETAHIRKYYDTTKV
jgi:hypothetical protein